MEHDIGSKIKAARIEKKLTQEQVAELLGVSRQTISNWENEKSYPDIISVIKMSECYDVSLDYLLKGEQKMKTYYDYLEESTNVVKSNTNRNKIITILSLYYRVVVIKAPLQGLCYTVRDAVDWCFSPTTRMVSERFQPRPLTLLLIS